MVPCAMEIIHSFRGATWLTDPSFGDKILELEGERALDYRERQPDGQPKRTFFVNKGQLSWLRETTGKNGKPLFVNAGEIKKEEQDALIEQVRQGTANQNYDLQVW